MSHPASLPTRSIVLHRFALSGHCHRVELFLRLLGLPFELRDVDLLAGAQKTPEFLRLNAFGQVPVIEDGALVLADSNAILVYLALRYAPPHWLPREPASAARVQRWLSVAAGPLASGPARARFTRVFGLDRDVSDAVAGAHALFSVVDAELAAEPFLAGPEPTIADLALYSYTAHAPEGGIALDGYPRLAAWLRRIEALPGFHPMAASPLPAAAGGR